MNTPANTEIADPYSLELESLDPSIPHLFEQQAHWDYFKRLREEDPVHFVDSEEFGPYWSITKFQDIVYVDSHHDQFSSEPSIVIGEPELDFEPPMFIAMDPPKHDLQRAAVTPAVKPAKLADHEGLIRERVCEVLDSLPIGEEFNWVDKVSIELTTRMLATLFDFPYEDRHLLTYWSDVSTSAPTAGNMEMPEEERQKILFECLEYFNRLWKERAEAPPADDFISLLAHNPDTRDMEPIEYLGNLMLLIVGGNDTTRNSMSGGVWALHQNPGEFAKLKADHGLIPNMVSEIIRWQTPLAHMRRIATEDVELGGKTIRKGDKVVMWYISGNRDATVIDDPDAFIIDRARARHHVSFGFGIHRCMGNRLGEMQLKILWEEILARFDRIEVVGDPVRVNSNFVMGYKELPVILHPLQA
jgi:cytochrome P450